MIKIACAVSAIVLLSPSAHAFTPSAKDAPGTLVITYELTGAGVEKPSSGERHVNWKVANKFVVTVKLKAEKAQGVPSLHPRDAKLVEDTETAAAAAEKATGDLGSMMAQAEKIFEKCGDDEACVERETLKMAGALDKDQARKAGESAKVAGEAAQKAAPSDGRYQNFGRGTMTGTYAIDEIAHEAYFDAACSTKNEATCSIDTAVKGAGALEGLKGETSIPATASIELDYSAQTAKMLVFLPGLGKATQTVKSGNPDRASGVSEVRRFALPEGFGTKTLDGTCAAGCNSASGTFTYDTVDPLLRRKAVLKITWKFTRP